MGPREQAGASRRPGALRGQRGGRWGEGPGPEHPDPEAPVGAEPAQPACSPGAGAAPSEFQGGGVCPGWVVGDGGCCVWAVARPQASQKGNCLFRPDHG